jgi:hypothetical protein
MVTKQTFDSVYSMSHVSVQKGVGQIKTILVTLPRKALEE